MSISKRPAGFGELDAEMGPNELLLWMSARQSGSWLQFRSALEDLGLDESEDNATNQSGLPLQHRFRLNLERLAHVEFGNKEGEDGWRVAPPVLAVTRTARKVTGILCGARSIPLLARLREAAGPAICEETQVSECPDTIRLLAEDERVLAYVAEKAHVFFQPEAALNLLSVLTPIERAAVGHRAEIPFGADLTIERFAIKRRRCRWEKVSQAEAASTREGLLRCVRWQTPEHYLRINGHTFATRGQDGKYFLLHRMKRRVIRYDANARKFQVPAICRPPALVDRALVLCSGLPPEEHYAQTANGESILILSYADVDAAIAGLVAEVLRQPLL
jgi:hypothetical protein